MIRLCISLTLIWLFSSSISAQRPDCYTDDLFQQQLKENSAFEKERLKIEAQTRQFINSNQRIEGVITIPIVFHIVHNGDNIGEGENISDDYILAQLQQLNHDFRRLNTDRSNTPQDFLGRAADVEIEFCLATIDPEGNATTGILRHQRTRASWTANRIDNTLKPETIWNRDHYLNFYIVRFGGNDNETLGYAQFPGGPAATDAVVCGFQYIGSLAVANAIGGNYGRGRTATHEVGHWLNLYHIWGDGACAVDDEVTDTPNQDGENYTSSPCSYPGRNSCNDGGGDLPDMFQNYMDYSDDACMNLYTTGQKNRMRALFDTNGARVSLLNSMGCANGSENDCSTCCSEEVVTSTTPTSNENIITTQTIISTASISAPLQITYQAGQSITLNSGFEATSGSTFSAIIEDCSSSVRTTPETSNKQTPLLPASVNTPKFPINNHRLSVHPNPFTYSTTIRFELMSTANFSLTILDMMGRQVRDMTRTIRPTIGTNEIILTTDQLPAGTFIVLLQTKTERSITKILLLREGE